MNEKQVKLNEFMIAFEKKSPLILISATAVNVTFVKKHPEASSLLLLLSLLLLSLLLSSFIIIIIVVIVIVIIIIIIIIQ